MQCELSTVRSQVWDPESICNLDVKRCFVTSDLKKKTASPLQNLQVELSASKLCPLQTPIDSLLVQESSLTVVGGTCSHITFSLSSLCTNHFQKHLGMLLHLKSKGGNKAVNRC